MYKKLLYKSSRSVSVSYSHGPASYPLKYLTISQQLYETAEKNPNNKAVISAAQNVTLTYPELYQKSKQLAAAFIHLGFQKNDRIGIYSPNNYEWMVTQYAAGMAGLILVNINPAYQSSELKYALSKVGCKGIVTASKFKSSNYIDILNEVVPEAKSSRPGHISSKDLPELKTLIRIDDEKTPGFFNFQRLFDMPSSKDFAALEQIENSISPEDSVNIQFTSGTTGNPKGATLSHVNIINNGDGLARRIGYTPKDSIAVSVPLYHCFGMVMGNCAALTSGATICYPAEGFNAKASLEAIEKYKLTTLYGVPTMFIEYLKEQETVNRQISSLKKGIIAGALAPRPLMEQIISKLGINEMCNCYGMTETSPVTMMSHPDDSFDHKVSTVGNVMDHMEAKIADADGKAVPYNAPGEYWTRGYATMLGYWGDPENTRKTKTMDGWLKSGDVAVMREDGYVSIVGRIKDMIIRGGENVYPKEIEDFLLTSHANIENVQVFGVPDEKFGEEICVWIKLKDSSKALTKHDIKAFCHKKIAHYKVPKYVKFTDDIPMTVTGKPQKFRMRDMMVEEFREIIKIEEYQIR